MSTKEIRKKLSDYIKVADDKKIKAIFTMVESEIEPETDIWTDDFLKEMERRAENFEKGKTPGLTWNEVRPKIRKTKKKLRV
jgi:hypothetical protein